MNFNISDEKLSQLIEKEITRYVRDKIERIMNDGESHWFSQQNIENITRNIIMSKITTDATKQIGDMITTDEFIHHMSDCIAEQIRYYLFA